MHAFILFTIAISASVLGALTGIGGGIIVKPVVDAAGLLSSATANFLCGCMVLSMSIVSIARNRRGPKPPMKFVAPLAFGAAAGGISGNLLFGLVKKAVGNNHLVVLVQACVLLVLLAGALLYSIFKKKIKNLHVKNIPVILLSGILLGLISAFLGIGGGPVNLVLLYVLFSLGLKEAAFGSLFVIAVSQTASLILTIAMGIPSFSACDLTAMILGGVGGGLIGSTVLKRISVNKAEIVYVVMIVAIIGICVFNIVRSAR